MAKTREELPERPAPKAMQFGKAPQSQQPNPNQTVNEQVIMEQAQPAQVQIQNPTPKPMQVPPPAQPLPPGMSGTPPLPAGRMVSTKHCTPGELATLKTIPGWREGDPVPENLAEILATVTQEAAASASDTDRMKPPVSLDTPPLNIPQPVNISSLPPEKQAEVQVHLDRAREAEAERARMGAFPQTHDPSVQSAIRGQNIQHVDLVDDREQAAYAGTNVPKSETAPAQGIQSDPAQAPAVEDTTGVNTPLAKCPHCEWPLHIADDAIPDNADKQRFIMAQMGGIAFEKEYVLLANKLRIVYRELKPSEVDAIYKQVYAERSRGEVQESMDFIEALSQYRLCLSLVSFQTNEQNHSFPKELSGWSGEPAEGDPTLLPAIHQTVYGTVIKTESLNRILGATLAHFGRTQVKMEANVESPDFWEETEQEPS